MFSIRLRFYLLMIEFVSDMYTIFKIQKEKEQVSKFFIQLNSLRRDIMQAIEDGVDR